jgi:hypothetical protein
MLKLTSMNPASIKIANTRAVYWSTRFDFSYTGFDELVAESPCLDCFRVFTVGKATFR